MNTKLYPFLCTICLPTLYGCTNKRTFHAGQIAVNVDEFAPVTDFFDSRRYVILETNDSSLIHGETKYRFSRDYIATYSEEAGFVIFDSSGKHRKTFDNQGEGPTEYVEMSDYYLQGDHIYVLSEYQSKLIKYDICGEFEKEFKLPDRYMYVTPMGKNQVTLCGGYGNRSMNNFASFNLENEEIVNEFMPYKHHHTFNFADFNAFVGSDDSIVYGVLPFSHDLYCITPDSCYIAASYFFNSDTNLPDITAEDVDLVALADEYRYKRVVKWLGCFEQLESGICYQSFSLLCDYGILPFVCKYDPQNKEAITLRIGAEYFPEFPYLMYAPEAIIDGEYITVQPADRLLRTSEHFNDSTFINSGIDEYSNPVVFYYHLKK